MMAQNKHHTQIEITESITFVNVASNNTNHSILVFGHLADVQTLERSVTNKVHSEISNAVATVGTRFYDAILAAMDTS